MSCSRTILLLSTCLVSLVTSDVITGNNQTCWSRCREGYCFNGIKRSGQLLGGPCIKGPRQAEYTYNAKLCETLCGSYLGTSYTWCYLDEELSSWEYCSWYGRTINNVACSGECNWYALGQYYWCYSDGSSSWDYCSPQPRI